jgi:hypothetical protein
MMNDEFKSPLSEIDNAGGQRAKRGGSTFAKATARQVRSRHRLEGSLSGGGGETPGWCGTTSGGSHRWRAPCKCQSSLLTLPERADKDYPYRGSFALSVLRQYTMS